MILLPCKDMGNRRNNRADFSSMPPVLYSFRRCPYAMRVRLAICYSGVAVELREVLLKEMPESLLSVSSKGTVPVLILPGGTVLDESWDIVQWALRHSDPENWLGPNESYLLQTEELLAINDGDFKAALDRYKYADRYPQRSAVDYRNQGEEFLAQLELRLASRSFLLSDVVSVADISIFPFIRQFAAVDPDWFKKSPYQKLGAWLNYWQTSALFAAVMKKYPQWKPGDSAVHFPV